MAKVTLDRETFKALASDVRLEILKILDGKKMSLNEISNVMRLNKATLHEHLTKLNEAGLVKKNSREGHKWVYYKLTWKGESLLHPENTKIVVLFTITFISLWMGIIQLLFYARGTLVSLGSGFTPSRFFAENEGGGMMDTNVTTSSSKILSSLPKNTRIFLDENTGVWKAVYQNPMFLYVAVICFVVFIVLLCVSIWRLWENRSPKL
ncbi:MAG: hypothetical protein DRN05_03635 [Thermoplasmata archaeon]|nr:MAG: hypothetical protein DRN05_03635 [Thermoplasmata archaeon]